MSSVPPAAPCWAAVSLVLQVLTPDSSYHLPREDAASPQQPQGKAGGGRPGPSDLLVVLFTTPGPAKALLGNKGWQSLKGIER